MSSLRILFLTACPTDRARPNVEREYAYIEDALARSGHGDRFDLRFVPAVRRDDVLRIIRRAKPDVIHFSGHGEGDELLFLDRDDHAEPMTADQLRTMLSLVPASERARVAVFSACYSEPHAIASVREIDCAVGMVSTMRDSAAFRFSAGFYLALGLGDSVHSAVVNARNEMQVESANLPTLHVREGVDATKMVLRSHGPVDRFPNELDIDRSEEVQCFESMLARAGESPPRLMLVTAEGNMGKSRLIRRMAALASTAPTVMLDLNRASLGPVEVIQRIAGSLALELDSSLVAAEANRDLSNLTTELTVERRRELAVATAELLARADKIAEGRGSPVALLLDGFDQPDSELAGWIETVLLPEVLRSRHVMCVLSGREAPEVAMQLHLVRRYSLANFGIDDIRRAMQALNLDVSEGQVRIFWVVTEGQPFVTMTKLMALWQDAVTTQ